MKFAVAALVATTSAIQLRAKAQGCEVPQVLADELFDMIDTNNNGHQHKWDKRQSRD